jgi:RND family efflux transporter MFP subunit
VRAVLGVLTVLVLALIAGGLVLACRAGGHDQAEKYYCPMHPTYVSDEPGDCPICNMRLVPFDTKTAEAKTLGAPPAAPTERKVLFYRSPMDPSVTSMVPQKDAMGMDFVPVYADETGGDSGVPGLATVSVDADGVRLAGVRTALATTESVARTTRTVGLVTPDERSIRHVHTRIGGWVEKLYVNYTGQQVRAGEAILSVYSPELLASQGELLRARAAAARFATSSLPEVRKGGEELVAASRQRLELFGVPRSFIAQVERSGKPQRAVTLTAPSSGFVTTKDVFEGQEVQPGMELFTLTELSHVWVEAEFYEYEAQLLRIGQPAEIRLPYDPGHGMRGVVSFIYPTLQPESRTLKVRVELDNPDGHLRPGMYVDVVTEFAGSRGVTVPDDAVIDTGARQVVFVERQPGTFEPREVRLGVRGEGRALILSGIREGEKVATRANFLLDSESRLRAAIANLRPAAPAAAAPPVVGGAAGPG